MCHIVYCGLPNAASKGDTAYAVFAMQEMFTRLRTIGITPQLCQAFIFGGGNMFPGMFSRKHVGTSNVEWVEHFLWTQGIEIVGESTGGSCYRKISWTVGAQALNVECVDSNDEDE